jgi:hypothetical protein
MAGDWIPIRLNLRDHPKVLRLVELTGLDRFAVIGRLVCFWAWASDHSEDGFLCESCNACVTALGTESSFVDALVKVGWCYIGADGVRIPQWDAWLSDSAKKRASTRRRVDLHRQRNREKASGNAPALHPKKCNASVTLQKRTEENRRDEEEHPNGCSSMVVGNGEALLGRVDWQAVIVQWNVLADRYCGGKKHIESMSKVRRGHLEARLRDHEHFWEEIERELSRLNDFAMSGDWFGFPWLIKSEENLCKLIEGNYRKQTSSGIVNGKSLEERIAENELKLQEEERNAGMEF